jgi:hypothetical protein
MRALPYFTFISLLAHLLALSLFVTTEKAPLIFETEIVLEPQIIPPRQIVSPSENREAPKEDTKKISDHDSQAEKETIKRGETSKASPSRQESPHTAPRKSVVQNEPKSEPVSSNRPTREITTLRLSHDKLFKSLSAENKPSLTSGVQDFMPSIPDGEITMLNAKADKFATFVRRVAEQVFSQIKSGGFLGLSIADLQKIETPVRFKAILSPQGELLRVESIFSSKVSSFDEIVKKAVTKGARDPNPPREALAADGNFHFIFQSEAKGWIQETPRGGRNERRWLLLSTGLE